MSTGHSPSKNLTRAFWGPRKNEGRNNLIINPRCLGLGTHEALHQTEHKHFATMRTNIQAATMAKNGKKVTLTKSDDKKALKPYCEQAKIAAENKRKADELRPAAAAYLQQKLDSDPETKDFTGTIVCIFEDVMYQIRVQRPLSVNWLEKRLDDPNHKKYKALMKEIEEKQALAKELETDLAKAHPKCVERGFSIAFLNK